MLARHVETLMNARGAYYPFRGVRDLFAESAAIIGNFEGAIPEQHFQTPGGAMRFSVSAAVAPVLARAGFTHFSLANNHADDYGDVGYRTTRMTLERAGIEVAGNPRTPDVADVLTSELDGTTVAILPLYAVVNTPDAALLERMLTAASDVSDLQVVFIHWGTEYAPEANDAQRTLARMLVDLGADAVIGHHPHVVQDIEEYRNALIFYSLGNFIFDQYWTAAVEEGLTLTLSIVDGKARYALIPVTSSETPSAPRPMNRVERGQFLAELADKSEESLQKAILSGVIERPIF